MVIIQARRKFMVATPSGVVGWMSRARTAEEVKHLTVMFEHHPNTYANDAAAAETIGRRAI